MAREKVTVTSEFKEVVSAYQVEHGFKSWSQALMHLAAVGYEQETGEQSPTPSPGQGGWRGSENSLRALIERTDRLTNNRKDDPTETGECAV